jgi:hypothetical protein
MIVTAMMQVMPLILSFMDGYTTMLLAYGEPDSGQPENTNAITIATAIPPISTP